MEERGLAEKVVKERDVINLPIDISRRGTSIGERINKNGGTRNDIVRRRSTNSTPTLKMTDFNLLYYQLFQNVCWGTGLKIMMIFWALSPKILS